MTTIELVQWCRKAEDVYEGSWCVNHHDLSLRQSVEQCQPPNASDMELDMAVTLICSLWNEIQTWAEM